MGQELDLVIRNGRVVDGTGSPARSADIGIRDGRIVRIGDIAEEATETIAAAGAVVAPGFIDVHTHYDAQVFWDPSLTPSSNHGVTTILGGNCGFSIAPLSGRPDDASYLMSMLSRVEGMPLESLREGVPWNWKSFGEYLGKLEGRLGLNAGFMVGHSALRRAVMGPRAVGHEATKDELAQMVALLRRSIEEGGLGFSSTSSPTHNDAEGKPVPSRWATEEEFLALCSVLRDEAGTIIEYLPDTAGAQFNQSTYERFTAMSLAARRPLNWNLLVPDSAMRDVFRSQLEASRYAAERGAKVIPLAAPAVPKVIISIACGFVFDALPGWAPIIALPIPERKARLADPAVRKELFERYEAIDPGAFGASFKDWSKWRIVETMLPANKSWDGKLVGELAAAQGKTPLNALLDLAIAEDLKTNLTLPEAGQDAESREMRRQSWTFEHAVIGGSDAGAHLDMIDTFAFSSMVLEDGVRKEGVLTLEDAVHRLTEVPARQFGIKDRGVLAPGNWADIVIFDPATIGRGPLHTRNDLPAGAGRLYCEAVGVSHVLVNGQAIVRDGKPTGSLPGTVLRSGRDTVTVPIGAGA